MKAVDSFVPLHSENCARGGSKWDRLSLVSSWAFLNDQLYVFPAEAFQSSLLHALAGSLCHFFWWFVACFSRFLHFFIFKVIGCKFMDIRSDLRSDNLGAILGAMSNWRCFVFSIKLGVKDIILESFLILRNKGVTFRNYKAGWTCHLRDVFTTYKF